MKYIRETSDIHLDFDFSKFSQTRLHDPGAPPINCPADMLWAPIDMTDDEETCLVIAGDLWQARKFLKHKHPLTQMSWMQMVSLQFKYLVFVLGNHDFWGANIHHEVGRIRQELVKQGLDKKVFLLENDAIVLDQVKFVGGTLWTDFHKADPMVMMQARMVMNDYRYMRAGPDYKKAMPQQLLDIHRVTRKFIFDNAKKDTPDQTVVVVTHHAPSYASIHPRYRMGRGSENFYYYSDLDYEIEAASDISLWFHGHCHCVSDYKIGNARVICNPRGYSGYEQTSWDPFLRIPV